MKKITVYADFNFLSDAQEIGTLGYEHVRGKDHFVFEYSRQWLKQYGGILLSGDLMNVPSLQHPRGNDNVFGFVKDSFPDRWGRLLLDRRERLSALSEGRPVRKLTDYDYLIGIEDFTRMGGIRYKEEDCDGYIRSSSAGLLPTGRKNASAKYLVPPVESLRALCDACHEIELAEERNINLRQRLASMWQRHAPSRYPKTATCCSPNVSTGQRMAVAFILLLPYHCLVLTMEPAAVRAMAIWTLWISFSVVVPMYGRISGNSTAGWHSTSCSATPTTTSAITVSCLPRKGGHSHLHTTSTREQSLINACSSTHIQKSRTRVPYSLQAKATCLRGKKEQRLSRRFAPPSKTGARLPQNCRYPSNCWNHIPCVGMNYNSRADDGLLKDKAG